MGRGGYDFKMGCPIMIMIIDYCFQVLRNIYKRLTQMMVQSGIECLV